MASTRRVTTQFDPSVKEIIKRDFDVDDMPSGAHITEVAAQLIPTVTKQLEKHEITLRKFASNMVQIIES